MENSTFWAIFIIVLVVGVTLGIAYTTSSLTGKAIFGIFRVKEPTQPTTTMPTTPTEPVQPTESITESQIQQGLLAPLPYVYGNGTPNTLVKWIGEQNVGDSFIKENPAGTPNYKIATSSGKASLTMTGYTATSTDAELNLGTTGATPSWSILKRSTAYSGQQNWLVFSYYESGSGWHEALHLIPTSSGAAKVRPARGGWQSTYYEDSASCPDNGMVTGISAYYDSDKGIMIKLKCSTI